MEGTTDSQDSEETQTPDTPPETTPQDPETDPEIPTTPEPETTPDTTVVPDPEVTPEEVVIPEASDEIEEEIAAAPATLADAVPVDVVTEAAVSQENYIIGTDEEGNPEEVSTSESDAVIDYPYGGVENNVFKEDFDKIVFTVHVASGKVLSSVGYRVGDSDKLNALSANSDGEYTIEKSKFITGSGDAKKISNVVIVVKMTEDAGYKLTLAEDGATSSFAIHPITTEAGKRYVDTTANDGSAFAMDSEETYEYAVVPGSGKAVAVEKVELTSGSFKKNVEFDEEELAFGADGDKATYVTFEVDNSDVESTATDTAITVTVTARDRYKLIVNIDDTKLGAAKNADIAAPLSTTAAGTTYIDYAATTADGKFKNDSEFVEASTDMGKSLRFAIKPQENYKITSVTATLNDGSKDTDVPVEVGDPSTAEATLNTVDCTIDLSQITLTAASTLKISADADLLDDDETGKIHKITFEAANAEALSRVTVTDENDVAIDTSKVLKTTEDTYKIKVAPKAGYELAKGTLEEGETDANKQAADKQIVTVAQTKTYTLDSGSDTKTVTKEVEAYVPAAGGSAEEIKEITLTLKASDDQYTGATSGDNKAYTANAVVSIGATPAANEAEKLIAFVDGIGSEETPSYAISTPGVLRDKYPATGYDDDAYKNNVWTIPEDQSLLTFTVTSDTKPSVIVTNSGTAEVASREPVSVADTVYTYEISTASLATYTSSTALNLITISKATEAKDLKIKVDTSDNLFALDATGIAYSINGTVQSETITAASGSVNHTVTNQPNAGDKVKLVFTSKADVTFGEVTYKMGETTGTADVKKLDDGKSTATIELTVTDNIEVDVKTLAPYYVVLSGSGVTQGEDGSFTVDYDTENIMIQLQKAGTPNASEKLYGVVVKDGTTAAATKAVWDNATSKLAAKIAKIDAADWGKTLTIEVSRVRGETYSAALKVNAASSAVTVTNAETEKAVAEGTPVAVMADSEITFKVTPGAGASLKDLKAEIRAAKDDATTGENNAAKKLATITSTETDLTDNGIITVTTSVSDKAEGQVLLCITNSRKGADGKTSNVPLKGGKITLDLTAPLVKSAAIKNVTAGLAYAQNKTVDVNLGMNFADKNKTAKAPLTGDLYYKVSVSNINAAVDKGTAVAKKPYVEYIPIAKSADGKSYIGSTLNLMEDLVLVESYKDEKGAAQDEMPGVATADVEVTLVQSKKASPSATAEADYIVGPYTTKISVSTNRPVFETKLKTKAANGGAVTTGQANAVIAYPVFAADTSQNRNLKVQFIDTKSGQLLGTPSVVGGASAHYREIGSTGNYYFEASVGADNGIQVTVNEGVYVNEEPWKTTLKTLGVKVTADTTTNGYAATAVIKLKVKQGIYQIEADESKAALPTDLYQDAKGTVKSVKITPKLNEGSKTRKPAKSTLTWKITNRDGGAIDAGGAGVALTAHMQAAVSGSKPLISVKNGTVSVNKAFKMEAAGAGANTFYVTAQAADFAGNPEFMPPIKFVITNKNQTIKNKLVVLNESREVQNISSLKADNFKSGLYIAAISSTAEERKVGQAYDERDIIPATFKVSGKFVSVDAPSPNNSAYLNFLKPGTAKITATTVDGGKGDGTKAELSLTIGGFTDLGLQFVSGEGITTSPDVKNLEYYGGSNQVYHLNLQYKGADGTWTDEYEYKNVKVAVKGGKFIASKDWKKLDGKYMGDAVVVSDKSGTATVTLTDTADKTRQPIVYTIKNNSNAQAKAPKITLYDPKKVKAGDDDLTFQVKATEKGVQDNYAGYYVKLTPDYTVARKNGVLDAYNVLEEADNTILKIDENGRFLLNTAIHENQKYNCRIIATVGDMVGGNFVAAAKDAKITLNVSAGKLDTGLKVTQKYTLDPSGAGSAEILVKTGVDYQITAVKNVIKDAKTQDANAHENAFLDYFEVVLADGTTPAVGQTLRNKKGETPATSAYIALKKTLTKEQIEEIQTKEHKGDCEGYLTVENGYGEKDVKITVSFKKVKLTATAEPVYANKKAIEIPVKVMNGKNEIQLADAKVTDNSLFKTKVEGGALTLTTTGAIEAGTINMNLKVLSADAAYTKTTKDKDNKTVANVLDTYGTDVTLKLTVMDPAKGKAINMGTSFTLSHQKYNATENGNGYEQAAGDEMGNYVIDIPYTLLTKDAKVKTGKTGIVATPNGDNIVMDGKTRVNIVTSATATTADRRGKDGKVVDNVPVIQLKISKRAISVFDKMDKAAKPLTGFGKTLTVPVAIQVENGSKEVVKTENLNIKLKLTDAPKTFAQMQEEIDKANIGKIQSESKTTIAGIIDGLKGKVGNRIDEVLWANWDSDVATSTEEAKNSIEVADKPNADGDSLATTSPTPTTDEIYAAIMEKGVAQMSIVLTDKNGTGDTKTATKSWDYTLKLLNSEDSENDDASVTAVKGAVETYLSGITTPTNDITIASLETGIREDAGVISALNKADRRGNIEIKVVYFEKKSAVANVAGYVAARVRIRDLVTGNADYATFNMDAGGRPAADNITALPNITDSKTKLDTKLGTDVLLKAIVQNCGGDEDRIRDEILKQAIEAVGNPAITITVRSCTYQNPVKEDGSLQDGILSFVLEVNEGGRVQLYKKANIKVFDSTDGSASDDAEKYVADARAAGEKLSAAIYHDDALDSSITLDATETDTAIKTALQTAIDTIVAANVYGYQAAVENFEYKRPTKAYNGEIKFTVLVTSKVNEGDSDSFEITAELGTADDTMLTIEELQTAIDALTEIKVDAAAEAKVTAALAAWLTEVAGTQANLAGELKGATIAIAKTPNTEYGMTDGKISSVNVTITAKKGSANVNIIEPVVKDITVTVEEAPAPPEKKTLTVTADPAKVTIPDAETAATTTLKITAGADNSWQSPTYKWTITTSPAPTGVSLTGDTSANATLSVDKTAQAGSVAFKVEVKVGENVVGEGTGTVTLEAGGSQGS